MYTELGEVTHFQAGSPIISALTGPNNWIETTASAHPYHVFFSSFGKQTNKKQSSFKNGVLAISSDTSTTIDVKKTNKKKKNKIALLIINMPYILF